MNYDNYKLESPFNNGSGFYESYESQKEKQWCPLCGEYFLSEEMTNAGVRSKHTTKGTIICFGCLNDLFTHPDSKGDLYPNSFVYLCRELKMNKEFNYENLIINI